MFSGGKNNIHEGGGKKPVEQPVCNPATHSCPNAPARPEVCVDPSIATAPIDAFAAFGMGSDPIYPVLTEGQSIYFKKVEPAPKKEATSAAYRPAIRSGEQLEEIFDELKATEVPPSVLEDVSRLPPMLVGTPPAVAPSAKSESYDFFGPSVDGSEYVRAYNDASNGLGKLGAYAGLPADKLVDADTTEVERGLAFYSYGAKSVYAEGISYGWTVSHALEFYKNSVFNSVRSSPHGDADPVGIVGFNFGLNMTDLNKRDDSGKLGDILRDRMRFLANQEFGRKHWDVSIGNGTKARDNIAATKNMTVLVMGASSDGTDMLTEVRAREGLERIQRDLQLYIESDEFKGKMVEAHGENASKINLEGVTIGLAGYYGEGVIDPVDAKTKGKLETSIVKFLGEMHYGEDIASGEFRSGNVGEGKAAYTHSDSVAGTEGARKATHKLYGLYASRSPGTDKTWKPKDAPRDALDVTERDIMNGDFLRPAHDFGLGLRHMVEIQKRYKALKDAVAEYKSVRRNNPLELDAALDGVERARADLIGYMESPPEAIDPTRTKVSERLSGDFLASRKVYRFRAPDGKTLFVYKPDHMPEVIVESGRSEEDDDKTINPFPYVRVAQMGGDEFTAVVELKNGKRVLVSVELGKFSDYMAKWGMQEGIKDRAFAQIFLFLSEKLNRAASEATTVAEIGVASRGIASDFQDAHVELPFEYSEKVPLEGGVWKGIQFGIKKGKVRFKKTADFSDKGFKDRIELLVENKDFKRVIAENFPEVKSLEDFEVVEEAEYGAGEEVTKHDVWHVDGSEYELHLKPGSECKSRGASRPERTLNMQVALIELESDRDLPFIMGEVLPKAVQGAKRTGEAVTVLPKLTAAQKAQSRIEYKLALSGGSFVLGSVGAEVIWNALTGRDIFDNVDTIHASQMFGILTLGGTAGQMAWRGGSAALAGNLLVKTPAGTRRVNWKALGAKQVGWRGKGMGALSTVASLAAVQYWETGKVDPVQLANTIAIFEAARWITKGLRIIGPVRKATNFNPIKFVAEILVMKALTAAEQEILESYMRGEKRKPVTDAMSRMDDALVAMAAAKARRDDRGLAEAADRYAKASLELKTAYDTLLPFEKYTNTEEYEAVIDANEEAGDLVDDLERIENMNGHPDDMPGHQRINYMSPVPGSTGVHDMHFSRSMVKDIRRTRRDNYAAAKESAYAAVHTAEEEFARNTLGLEGRVSGVDLHIPFSSEKDVFVAHRVSIYDKPPVVAPEAAEVRYGPEENSMSPERRAERDWEARYERGLDGDPHKLHLQYILFMKERNGYFMDLMTKSSDASDSD